MSSWLRVERGPGGGILAPPGGGPDAVCFLEAPSEAECWARRYPVRGADLAAAREWAATAQAAAATVRREAAAVVGEGALATLVRLALSATADPDSGPGFAVETTGTAVGITEALRLVRSRGTIVLAARPLRTTISLRTYHDVHRPGVCLVPVPWAGDGASAAPDRLLAWALAHVASIEPGRPVPPAPWYRLVVGERSEARSIAPGG